MESLSTYLWYLTKMDVGFIEVWMSNELSGWDLHRIEYYNGLIVAKYEEASVAEGAERDAIFDDIALIQDVVSRLERGAPPPKPIEQKQYYVEPEDDGCAGGACKI
jgi:hypothetical protein